jgi:hypothetical protein
MTQIINSTSTGILCVDEVQHLSLRGGGSKLMLNFFTTLSNMIGIPIVLIGTPSAMNVLQREFRQARRGSGQGDLIMDRMENDAYWRLFLESMWEYQWVRNPIELTDELAEVMYQESQGIIDICLKIFSLSQIRAISSGSECLSVTLVRQVARDHLKLVQPMLTALKSGDMSKIAQYEDIYFPFQEAVERERIDLEKNDFIKAMKNKQKSVDDTKLREEGLFRLNLLGLSKEKANKAINEVCKATTFTDLQELVKSAYQHSVQIAVANEDIDETKGKSENDLRAIVTEGKEKGLSAYASLKEAGIIKQIKEVV